MILDAHSHWLPPEIIRHAHFHSPAWGDIESQLAAMDRCGVEKTLIVYPTNDAHARLGGYGEGRPYLKERKQEKQMSSDAEKFGIGLLVGIVLDQ